MKYLILILFFTGNVLTWAQSSEIRQSYHAATQSKEKAEAFYKLVKDVEYKDKAELVAYKGAAITLVARFEPLTKRKAKVKEGIKWVEEAVSKAPNSVEVRLIRLSIQENLPKMFKYDGQIASDKKFIKDALPNIKDKELVEMINGYLTEFSKK